MKAVNMKKYIFRCELGDYYMHGFGIYDEQAGAFVATDSGKPYVLDRKKDIEECIAKHFGDYLTNRIKPVKVL